VLGDFNDGPGLDEYERLFGHSGVEIVLGLQGSRLFDPHAKMALASRVGLTPTTARFWLAPPKRYFEALLDFIMVSPDLFAHGSVADPGSVQRPRDRPPSVRCAVFRRRSFPGDGRFAVMI